MGRWVLQSIVTVVAILFPAVILGQTSGSDPQLASSGIRDRDRALAGAREIQNDLGRANFHRGPWYLLTRLQLSDIGFSEEFFVPTGDENGGLSLSASAPTRLYLVPHKKLVLSGEFVPGVTYFNGTDGSNRQFNYSARGGVQFLFNHLFLDLYASKADHLRPRIGDINRLATLKSNEYGLSGELKYSSRTSVTFSTRVVDLYYPSDRYQPRSIPVDLLDRNEHHGRVQLIHKTLPRTSFTVAAELSDFDFDRATYKNGTKTYAAGGLIFDAPKFVLKGEAGIAQLRFDDATQKDYEGVLGQISATWKSGRNTLSGGLERDTDFTIMANNNYYVMSRVSASAERTMTRRLRLRAAYAGERDEYDVPVLGHIRTDETSFPTVGFRYTLRKLTTGIDVGYYRRTSTYGGDESNGIRYILLLSFTP